MDDTSLNRTSLKLTLALSCQPLYTMLMLNQYEDDGRFHRHQEISPSHHGAVT